RLSFKNLYLILSIQRSKNPLDFPLNPPGISSKVVFLNNKNKNFYSYEELKPIFIRKGYEVLDVKPGILDLVNIFKACRKDDLAVFTGTFKFAKKIRKMVNLLKKDLLSSKDLQNGYE
ncbi:MAG: hypothetical protein ACLFQV_13565, partial [Vulcanimicrobiota bacterium]